MTENRQKNYTEIEGKFCAFREFIPKLILELDENSIITFVNRYIEHFGYLQEEVVGKSIFEFIHPDDRKQADRSKSAAISPEEYLEEGIKKALSINTRRSSMERITRGLELRFKTKNGVYKKFRFEAGGTVARDRNGPIFDTSRNDSRFLNIDTFAARQGGRFLCTYVFGDDHTEIKDEEQRLISSREKAKISDELKTSFISNMSHEFRTPLNGIIGFTELLAESVKNKEEQEYCGIIQSSAQIMLHLINDVIDISRMEAGRLKINNRDIYLPDLFNNIQKIILEKINREEKDINLHLSIPDSGAAIKSDPLRLQQVLINLLTNAVKFTEKGTISFGYDLEDSLTLKFFVEDTGIGIPTGQLDNIFKRFVQVRNPVQFSNPGSGLGLAISEGLVKLLGGRLEVASREGKGTRFTFTLPHKEPDGSGAPIKAEVETGKESDHTGSRILVTDDDETSCILTEKVLTRAGYKPLFARCGEEAVDACSTWDDIELVLMDMRMDGMDGYEAAGIIKREKSIPVIALTACAMVGDREKCLRAGCDDYLAKPYLPEKLMEKVNCQLSKRRK